MTDPGLNQRLRQRSRRSGLMIGFSMLLTLMVCVASFTVIYSRLEPVVADFVGRGDIELPTAVPTTETVAEAPEPTTVPEQAEATTEDAPAEEGEESPSQGGDNQIEPVEEDDEPEGFEPDYQIESNQPVNLRPGPGVATGDAIEALPVQTPLMYMGESIETEDPDRDLMEPGQVWMLFQLEDGTEGWVRELDIIEYQP